MNSMNSLKILWIFDEFMKKIHTMLPLEEENVKNNIVALQQY